MTPGTWLRRVVLAGFISRQTILLFIVTVVLAAPLYWTDRQWRLDSERCLKQQSSVKPQTKILPVAFQDTPPAVGFYPCFIWREPTATEKVTFAAWFLSAVGFVLSFLLDAFWGIRTKVYRKKRHD